MVCKSMLFGLLTISSFLILSLPSWAGPVVVPVVPQTNLSFWNRDGVQPLNNCYNYSTNRETDSFAQPGEASGRKYSDLTCAAVLAAASADLGLVRTKPFPLHGATNQDTLIALVVDPGNDFHWYRRDVSGKWTHKPGAWPATNVDNSGKVILSPEKADRGRYSDFCGYFRVKNYAYQKNLQNGGYVRIGSMSRLPALPSPSGARLSAVLGSVSEIAQPSEIEVLAYSGRPNPKIPLREALSDPAIAGMLAISSNQYAAIIQATIQKIAAPKLGATAVVIRDHEGLIFARGSVVYLPITQEPVLDPAHPAALGNALQNFVISKQ